MVNRPGTGTGTVIGMNKIKLRRLNELMLSSHPGLRSYVANPKYIINFLPGVTGRARAGLRTSNPA